MTTMNIPMNIPMGFRFSPTDEELISYLLRRGMGLQLNPSGAQHQHILERHLYGEKADPWHVFEDVDDSHWDLLEGSDKRVIYVITKLSKISNGKTRIARRAGCGTWSGQTPPKKIFNESSSGQWVGTKRMLSFERSGGVVRDPHDQHHWIMHEYSLDGIYTSKHQCQIIHQDYVICRITRVKTIRIQESCQPVLSIKKRSPQDRKEEETATCCVKKQKPDHQFLDAQMMLPELPLSTPHSDSITNFSDWTQEDFSFLDDLLGGGDAQSI